MSNIADMTASTTLHSKREEQLAVAIQSIREESSSASISPWPIYWLYLKSSSLYTWSLACLMIVASQILYVKRIDSLVPLL